jgi:transposase-like protein
MPSILPRFGLSELTERFNCDGKCREYLEQLRWPSGPVCPKCGKKEIARVVNRDTVLRCIDCQAQFTVMAGTIFNDSHLPLAKWFIATFLLCESKKGISALQMQRILKIGGYKTAWYLCHRIRAAMLESQKAPLDGVVEIDETYVGGKPRINRPRREKDVVIGIRQRDGQLRLFRARDAKAATVAEIIRQNVSETVQVLITDESAIHPWALEGKRKKAHKTICHKNVYVSGDVHTNTVESAFSLLKRGIVGTWHNISVKHLPAYLDEMSFRFNRRGNDTLFQDTLRHMVTAPVLTFKKLTKEKAA